MSSSPSSSSSSHMSPISGAYGDELVLIDFGSAMSTGTSRRALYETFELNHQAGSTNYAAPELARGVASQRSDMFSMGVILYVMLCGRLPFSTSDKDATSERLGQFSRRYGYDGNRRAEDSFSPLAKCDQLNKAGASAEVRSFLSELCAFNPLDRPTAFEVLDSPWLMSAMERRAAFDQLELGEQVQA